LGFLAELFQQARFARPKLLKEKRLFNYLALFLLYEKSIANAASLASGVQGGACSLPTCLLTKPSSDNPEGALSWRHVETITQMQLKIFTVANH